MSFRLKTILSIAFIEVVVLVLLIISGMKFLSASNELQLKQRAEATSILLSKAVKDAVLSTDLATLESFTEDVMTLPGIIYTRISNDDFVFAEAGEPEFLNRLHAPDNKLADVSDGVFDVSVNIIEGGVVYGKIEIGLSTAPIEQTLSEAQHWAIIIASIEVTLVAFFSFIIGTYLTRRLLQLREASEEIARAGPGHQIEVTGKDEIADVAHAFNQMSSTLANNYKELSKSIEAEQKMSATAQQNQAKNHAILTASLDALITIDKEGNVVDYNKVAEHTFGWSCDEIVGENLADFITPKNKRDAHVKGIKKFLLTKKNLVINQRLELTALHKSGYVFPIEINIAPIETQQGTQFTAFIRDISPRLKAEAELRLAAQTFESSEAMFISTVQGSIIKINQSFTDITGYNKEDVIGKNPRILASGRHSANYFKSMWITLQTEGKWTGEIYNKRKNGEIYPEYLNISSVKDKKGNLTHFIAHFMDITEQKNNEEHLRQARTEAEASNESKSHFLASMSHEIRTPMNAVLGILELLKDTQLTEKQINLISTARDSGELLMTIINDILDFTKMDIDEHVLQLTEFNLHKMLNNCITLLNNLAEKKSLQLSLQQSADFPKFVKGDSERIQQILINLINNAIKFTEHGSITLVATLDSNNNGLLVLRFQVLDTGIGIHENNQTALFDEFTMVDQTHSRKYEGTGLGLAICKRLITLMNGNIEVHSQLGKGSTFEFTIELESSDETNVQHNRNKELIEAPHENTRILLAEDNLANQMVIKSILEASKLYVEVVNNGYEALQAVQKASYDILLMDISMPEMDGMTATKEIRKLTSESAEIPIIALTAHTLSGDKARFLEAGMNDYLSKPINRIATLNCIFRWTQQCDIQQSDSEVNMPITDNDELYVDESVLLQLVEDTDAEIVPELIMLYIEDSLQRLEQIKTAITKQDFASLEFETHTVGSSAVAHGNAKLYKLSRKIEMFCRENELQQALEYAQGFANIAEKSFELLAIRANKGF
ncbi:MAG: PAS domain S-box protein [Psychromonas sp.]|nr:PAS domain S-box protein [Psychromonas sp.]